MSIFKKPLKSQKTALGKALGKAVGKAVIQRLHRTIQHPADNNSSAVTWVLGFGQFDMGAQ